METFAWKPSGDVKPEKIDSVEIVEFRNGWEQRMHSWNKTKRMFTVEFRGRKPKETRDIVNFYNARQGAYEAFWWINPYGENWSLSFDGSSGYVSVPDDGYLDLTSAFTIEAWVYLTADLASQHTIVSKGDGTDGYGVSLRVGNYIHVDVRTQSVELQVSWLRANTWYLIGVALDPDADKVYYYVNGVGLGSSSLNVAPSVTSLPLYVGREAGTAVNFFRGLMDGVKVFDKLFSAADMANHAKNVYPDAGSNLILDLQFNEGEGTVANDDSDNSFDGTISGCTWNSKTVNGERIKVRFVPKSFKLDHIKDGYHNISCQFMEVW